MTDSKFYKSFKDNMDAMGLPAPASLFGTFAVAISTTSAIAGAITKLGSSATIAEVLLTIPAASGAAAFAAGVSEVCVAAGALVASFYLGACIGCLIAAAFDVYGASAYYKLKPWMAKMGKYLQMPAGDYMFLSIMRFPELSPMRRFVDKARLLDGGSRNTGARYA